MSPHAPPRSIITRTRERLACTECRRRKLKCDRESPCGACARRNDQESCVFQKFQSSFDLERERRVQAEARLEHLEELVRALAKPSQQPSSQASPPGVDKPPAAENDLSHGLGLLPTAHKAPYLGETHWSAMLEDIDELRMMSADDGTSALDWSSFSEPPDDRGISIVFGGGQRSYTFRDLLAQYLPSRKETDRLLSTYFRSQALAAPFIHSATFRKQYQAFWDNRHTASPLWTSILFSMCHIASSTLRTNTNGSPPYNDCYAIASAHCLVIGDYFRPNQFAPESTLLFVQAQCLSSQSLSHDIAVLMSHTVRIATMMGYHRDPSHGKWSPFQGEMRRRVWSLILQLDLLISFHMGLPSTVQYPTWDTLPPRNLTDSDLDETMTALPPARPDDFPSEILFYNTKLLLMTIFEKIQRHILSTRKDETWFVQVDGLDNELREVWASLPSIYSPRSMSDSVLDTSHIVVTRLCVNYLYYKCLCVLHRPYARLGRWNSVKVCLEASTGLVNSLLDAAKEFEPGGQTETERWFMSALTWHDFLLGSTALCSILCIITGPQMKETATKDVEINVPEMIESLGRAKNLCFEHASSRSPETTRVAKLLERVLNNFTNVQHSVSASTSGSAPWATQDIPSHGVGMLSFQDNKHFEVENGQNDWPHFPTQGPLDDESWAFLQQFVDMKNISSNQIIT